MKIGLYIKFYRDVNIYNASLAIIASMLTYVFGSMMMSSDEARRLAVNVFAWIYLTGGFAFANYLYYLFRRKEIYIYYNRNLSRTRLISFCLVVNTILVAMLLIVLKKYM